MCVHTTRSVNPRQMPESGLDAGMSLRTTQRRNKDGSVVRYLQLAHNRRSGASTQAEVLVNLGREDRLVERVKPGEAVPSGLSEQPSSWSGLLIHAATGTGGGVGARRMNRSGVRA